PKTGGIMSKRAQILRRLGIVGAVLVAPALGATAAVAPALGDAWNHQHAYAALAQSAPGHPPQIRAGLVPPDVRDHRLIAQLVRADTAFERPPQIRAGLVPPDVRDRRLIAQLVRADRASSQSSFDWGAAGIGAGSTLALILLAFGGALLIRGR